MNQVLPYSNHTQIIPRTKLATAAVSTLLAHSKSPWWMLNFPSGIHPIIMATTEAKNPTTIAWHWKWNTIHVYQHFYESMWFLNILYCFLVLKVKLYNYQYNIVISSKTYSLTNYTQSYKPVQEPCFLQSFSTVLTFYPCSLNLPKTQKYTCTYVFGLYPNND